MFQCFNSSIIKPSGSYQTTLVYCALPCCSLLVVSFYCSSILSWIEVVETKFSLLLFWYVIVCVSHYFIVILTFLLLQRYSDKAVCACYCNGHDVDKEGVRYDVSNPPFVIVTPVNVLSSCFHLESKSRVTLMLVLEGSTLPRETCNPSTTPSTTWDASIR
jgi:hypothetical protein